MYKPLNFFSRWFGVANVIHNFCSHLTHSFASLNLTFHFIVLWFSFSLCVMAARFQSATVSFFFFFFLSILSLSVYLSINTEEFVMILLGSCFWGHCSCFCCISNLGPFCFSVPSPTKVQKPFFFLFLGSHCYFIVLLVLDLKLWGQTLFFHFLPMPKLQVGISLCSARFGCSQQFSRIENTCKFYYSFFFFSFQSVFAVVIWCSFCKVPHF